MLNQIVTDRALDSLLDEREGQRPKWLKMFKHLAVSGRDIAFPGRVGLMMPELDQSNPSSLLNIATSARTAAAAE